MVRVRRPLCDRQTVWHQQLLAVWWKLLLSGLWEDIWHMSTVSRPLALALRIYSHKRGNVQCIAYVVSCAQCVVVFLFHDPLWWEDFIQKHLQKICGGKATRKAKILAGTQLPIEGCVNRQYTGEIPEEFWRNSGRILSFMVRHHSAHGGGCLY